MHISTQKLDASEFHTFIDKLEVYLDELESSKYRVKIDEDFCYDVSHALAFLAGSFKVWFYEGRVFTIPHHTSKRI